MSSVICCPHLDQIDIEPHQKSVPLKIVQAEKNKECTLNTKELKDAIKYKVISFHKINVEHNTFNTLNKLPETSKHDAFFMLRSELHYDEMYEFKMSNFDKLII